MGFGGVLAVVGGIAVALYFSWCNEKSDSGARLLLFEIHAYNCIEFMGESNSSFKKNAQGWLPLLDLAEIDIRSSSIAPNSTTTSTKTPVSKLSWNMDYVLSCLLVTSSVAKCCSSAVYHSYGAASLWPRQHGSFWEIRILVSLGS